MLCCLVVKVLLILFVLLKKVSKMEAMEEIESIPHEILEEAQESAGTPPNMEHAFLDIKGIPTKVVTYRRWVEQTPKLDDPEDVIVIIPGNPGFTSFYETFMLILHEKTGYPVWLVGHAGHEVPHDPKSILPLKGNENIFGVKGQIEHKKNFIEKYIPKNAKIHLIGHSLGSHMILNLLKEESIKSRVENVCLLFPAIEYMGESPKGIFFQKVIKHVTSTIVFLSWIYTFLPYFLKNIAMCLIMVVKGLPLAHLKKMVEVIHPSAVEKIYFIAFDAIGIVKERDDEIIRENFEKIKFLYGHDDHWVPEIHCHQLKNDFPGIHAEIREFRHSFVLRDSRGVGSIVSDWIAKY